MATRPLTHREPASTASLIGGGARRSACARFAAAHQPPAPGSTTQANLPDFYPRIDLMPDPFPKIFPLRGPCGVSLRPEAARALRAPTLST